MSGVLDELTREELIAVCKEQMTAIEHLKFRLSEFERLIFGSKSERFIADKDQSALQLGLFANEGVTSQAEAQQKEQITYERNKPKAKNANHPGRNGLPEHLERVDIEIQPQEDTTEMKFIGWEVSEKLAYKPAELYVNRYKRAKYARANEEGVICPSMPAHLFDKCIAEPSLISKIIVDKYVDHLPVDRQYKAFKRQGVDLPTSTGYDWIKYGAARVDCLYEALCNLVLASYYLQLDESPIQVLDKELKGKTHRGYMWVFRSPELGLTFFQYQPGRGQEFPRETLKDFTGYLQTDAYGAYDQFKKNPDIYPLNCMSHARREFEKGLKNDYDKSQKALIWIQQLYKVERKARDGNLDYEARKDLRQIESKPVIDQLEQWMEEVLDQTTPQSPIGKALRYYYTRKYYLRRYLEDGRLEIDNNSIENKIRPLALGRKNYLFAGSHEAAQRTAVFYSLFATCAEHDINPIAYLTDVLERIPEYPINRIEELLPHRWKETFDQSSG